MKNITTLTLGDLPGLKAPRTVSGFHTFAEGRYASQILASVYVMNPAFKVGVPNSLVMLNTATGSGAKLREDFLKAIANVNLQGLNGEILTNQQLIEALGTAINPRELTAAIISKYATSNGNAIYQYLTDEKPPTAKRRLREIADVMATSDPGSFYSFLDVVAVNKNHKLFDEADRRIYDPALAFNTLPFTDDEILVTIQDMITGKVSNTLSKMCVNIAFITLLQNAENGTLETHINTAKDAVHLENYKDGVAAQYIEFYKKSCASTAVVGFYKLVPVLALIQKRVHQLMADPVVARFSPAILRDLLLSFEKMNAFEFINNVKFPKLVAQCFPSTEIPFSTIGLKGVSYEVTQDMISAYLPSTASGSPTPALQSVAANLNIHTNNIKSMLMSIESHMKGAFGLDKLVNIFSEQRPKLVIKQDQWMFNDDQVTISDGIVGSNPYQVLEDAIVKLNVPKSVEMNSRSSITIISSDVSKYAKLFHGTKAEPSYSKFLPIRTSSSFGANFEYMIQEKLRSVRIANGPAGIVEGEPIHPTLTLSQLLTALGVDYTARGLVLSKPDFVKMVAKAAGTPITATGPTPAELNALLNTQHTFQISNNFIEYYKSELLRIYDKSDLACLYAFDIDEYTAVSVDMTSATVAAPLMNIGLATGLPMPKRLEKTTVFHELLNMTHDDYITQ